MNALMHGFISDLRVMWRQFRQMPLLVLSCIGILAIGVGGTTAAFSALYAVALHPMPYTNPKQLVAVHSQFPRLQLNRLGVSPLDYLDLSEYKDLFSQTGAFFYLDLSRTGMRHAEKVNAVATTTSMFKTLGVLPTAGRYFLPVEERTGGLHVVILGEAYWQAAFSRDPHVLQKTIQLNGERYSVIGVMPRSFTFPNDATEMWVPTVFKPEWLGHLGRQNVFLHMYARLAGGLTFNQASKRLEIISRQAAIRNRGDYTVDLAGWKYFIIPLSGENNSSLQSWTWILFWSVTALFAIVCVNVGGLLVLRSTQRAFEFSVRLALGAGVLRIAQGSILEVGTICTMGGIAGAFTAALGVRLLNVSGQFGRLHVSFPVLAFGIALTLAAAAFCSVYPLWRATRSNPVNAMSAGGHQRTESHSRQYVRRTLVVIQVAASTALLIVAGLLLHTYTRLLQTPLGFDPDRVMTMQISLPPLRYASESSRRLFYESVVDRIRHVPGISGATACTVVPFGYGESIQPFSVARRNPEAAQQLAAVNSVFPNFFGTLRIPLLAGRYFNAHDTPGHEYTVVIDQKLADQYFPHQNAIGQQLKMGERFSIVGVVGNIKAAGLDVSDVPMLYLSALQMPSTDMSVLVKSSKTMDHAPELVQAVVAGIDRDQPVYDVASLQSRVSASLSARRFVAFLLTSFSAIGIVITAIGLYGVLSYSVLLRGREFGIRSAVGATPRDLGLLIFRYGMQLVAVGALFGSAIAISVSRYLSAELYGLRVTDPITWLVMTITLAGIGIAACIAPSWRASHMSAVAMLTQE